MKLLRVVLLLILLTGCVNEEGNSPEPVKNNPKPISLPDYDVLKITKEKSGRLYIYNANVKCPECDKEDVLIVSGRITDAIFGKYVDANEVDIGFYKSAEDVEKIEVPYAYVICKYGDWVDARDSHKGCKLQAWNMKTYEKLEKVKEML